MIRPKASAILRPRNGRWSQHQSRDPKRRITQLALEEGALVLNFQIWKNAATFRLSGIRELWPGLPILQPDRVANKRARNQLLPLPAPVRILRVELVYCQ